MSVVTLTSFAIYKRHGDVIEAVSNVASSCITANGKVELTVGSVPFISASFGGKAPAPSEGILMLYGMHDVMDELCRVRGMARAAGALVGVAEFDFEIGDIEVGLMSREMLATKPGSQFVNVRRMTAGLQSQLLLRLSDYVSDEGGNSDESMSRMAQIAARPDLFSHVFKDDKDFAKLTVLVIPLCDSEGSLMRQVAFVRPGARLVSVRQGSDVELVLPSSMKSSSNQTKEFQI